MTDKKLPELTLIQDDSLPLRDVVCKTLRSAILDGTLQPGTRLMELHLAAQLGVSRTPVREAIRLLEMDSLVDMHPRRGAVVAQISASDLRDVLEVRQALEELAVRKACRNMDTETLAQLEEAEKVFEDSLRKNSLSKRAEADVAFHTIITEASHNQRLKKLLTAIREQIYRYRLENLKDKDNYPTLIAEHKALIEAFRAGDEDGAAAVILNHIENQKQTILANL